MTAVEYLPDGVYFDLDEELYFGQDALGSSDLMKLWKFKHGWWWQSRWNPDRVEKVSKERMFGRASHKIILEGMDAYERTYAVTPTCPKGALVTVGDVQAALQAEGFHLRGVSNWRAADWFAAAATNIPHVPCWPNIMADFDEERGQKPVVTAVQDRALRVMFEAAMGNPAIANLFGAVSGFPPLAEISILFTDPTGTRRRWRLDRMFPAFNLDLKTMGNWDGRPLPYAVGDIIGRGGLDIQRADYDVGRAKLYDFVRAGKVQGGTLDQRAFLQTIVEAGGKWDWVWIFYQKPDPSGRAPVIFPVMDESGSDLALYGQRKAAKAMKFYRDAVAEFGLERPWTHVEDLHYTAEEFEPRITLPHWVAEEEPSGEASAWASNDDEVAA